MPKNEHEYSNININAQNWALMTKNEHLFPTFEHFFSYVYNCEMKIIEFFRIPFRKRIIKKNKSLMVNYESSINE